MLETEDTGVVVVGESVRDGLEANANRYLFPIFGIYLKVYVVNKNWILWIFVHPFFYLLEQSLEVFFLYAAVDGMSLNLLWEFPNVDSSLDIFGVASQSFAFSFTDFY